MTQLEIIRMARKHFGLAGQLRKLEEECIELALAIHHFLEGDREDLDSIYEEAGDVEVMLDGLDLKAESNPKVESWRAIKVTRLQGILEKEGAL